MDAFVSNTSLLCSGSFSRHHSQRTGVNLQHNKCPSIPALCKVCPQPTLGQVTTVYLQSWRCSCISCINIIQLHTSYDKWMSFCMESEITFKLSLLPFHGQSRFEHCNTGAFASSNSTALSLKHYNLIQGIRRLHEDYDCGLKVVRSAAVQ